MSDPSNRRDEEDRVVTRTIDNGTTADAEDERAYQATDRPTGHEHDADEEGGPARSE